MTFKPRPGGGGSNTMTNRYRLASQELSAALKNWEDGEGPTIGGRKAISQALSDAIEDAINSTADEIIEGDSVTTSPSRMRTSTRS